MGVSFANVGRADRLRRELDAIVSRLRSLDVEKIILFGSFARSEGRSGRDLDLLVVMRTDARFVDRLDLMYRTARPTVACDFFVYTPEEMQWMPETSSLVRSALCEGDVLYEKTAGR